MAREVKYSISADSSKYEKAMSRVKSSTQSAGAVLQKAFKRAGIVGAAGVGAFTLMAREALKLGDEVHKLNLRLGISTEELSELRHVANLSGVNFNTMAKSYQKMSENISDANQGIGTAKDSIGDLGLNVESLIKLSPGRQFELIADAMKGIANQSDKVRIAADIFGGRGVEMLQIVAGGAEGIREMRREAGELGLTLSQEGANKIAAFNDEVVRLKGSVMGIVQAIVIDLAPGLVVVIDRMKDWIVENRKFITLKAHEAIGKIGSGIKSMIELYERLPEGVVGAAGYGIIGTLLFGPQAGAVIAMLAYTSSKIDEFKRDHPEMFGAVSGGGVITGKTGPQTPGYSGYAADGGSGLKKGADLLGVPTAEVISEELARLVEAEEMKFQIAMQSQTKLEEMLAVSNQKQIAMDRDASMQRLALYEQAAGRIASTFAQVAQAGGKYSREAFRIYQAFAMVQAGISGALAYMMALGDPTVPPTAARIFLAKVIAGMTAIQIGLIAAAKPPTYDMGGISTTPGYYYAGVPEAHIPLPSGGEIPVVLSGDRKSVTTVNIIMENPTFQDVETQRQALVQIAEVVAKRVAPGAVIQSYMDDKPIRGVIRGRK